MNNIIYLKKVDEYDDILKNKHNKIPKIFKKIIFWYKTIFNIITKKQLEKYNVWILPLKEKYSYNKIDKIINKISVYKKNTYVIASNLENKELYELINKYSIKYLSGINIKKFLSIKILEYINNILKNEININSMEITILVNQTSSINLFLIEKLCKIVKTVKIVTPNIYQFKNFEEKIYKEYGIAIQFSNSYRKSLEKSRFILNLDFNNIDINEYKIYNNSIIINCMNTNIKIKSKLFNGIIVNSCDIKFKNKIQDDFIIMNIYDKYNNLVLYESIIEKEKNFNEILNKLDIDKVVVNSLIGNNGIINKSEFMNIKKKLDK